MQSKFATKMGTKVIQWEAKAILLSLSLGLNTPLDWIYAIFAYHGFLIAPSPSTNIITENKNEGDSQWIKCKFHNKLLATNKTTTKA